MRNDAKIDNDTVFTLKDFLVRYYINNDQNFKIKIGLENAGNWLLYKGALLSCKRTTKNDYLEGIE